jgi:tetrahydromethanopterin S-methyltransferase subunit G
VSDETRTLGEVARRLEEVVSELREMRREAAEDRQRFEARFLPRAEFELAQQSDAIQLRGLENETHSVARRLDAVDSKVDAKSSGLHGRIDKIEERRRGDRALVLTGLAFPLILLLVGVLVTTGRI